jgi:hypothetical protein
MKKQITIAIFIFVFASLNFSCKSTKSTSQATAETEETTVMSDPEKSRINRFVSVDNILDLRTGLSIDEAVSKLGSKPYNVFSAQADGHHIVQYKYRLTKYEVPADDVNNYGIEKKSTKVYYAPGEQDLYILFNAAGKLEYMVTSQGGINEQLLRQNNLLYVIKKDKDKFAADSDKLYRQTNSNPFHPLMPCTTCDKDKKDNKPADDKKNTITIKLEPAGKN